jgi:hypothetical protein
LKRGSRHNNTLNSGLLGTRQDLLKIMMKAFVGQVCTNINH